MKQVSPLILASGSEIRATILRNAGVPFDIIRTGVDEDIIKKAALSQQKTLPEIATDLAIAKAKAANVDPDRIVLGADQILEFENRLYDKPKSKDEARARFLVMAGKPHTLINAAVLVRNGEVIWQHIERPVLYLRDLSDQELDRYFAACDDGILKSVGAYQVEGYGMRLFEKLEGDYFAILGLALSPLLNALREFGVIDF